jgi:TetR/AcrR family transcriptional regulator, regulator of biofilm formation and stress response
MTPTLNGKRSSSRRRDIVEATLRLICQEGVNGISHRAVAAEAKVPLASTTYYFDSKDALVEEALELAVVRFEELLRRHTTPSSRIGRVELTHRIVAFAAAQMYDPDAVLMARLDLIRGAGRSPHLAALARRWDVAYLGWFSVMMRKARMSRPNVASEVVASFVGGMMMEYVMAPRDDFVESYLQPLLTDLMTAWWSANERSGGKVGATKGQPRSEAQPRRAKLRARWNS